MDKERIAKLIRKIIVPLGLFAIILGILGGEWDAWFHVKHEHELLSAPHLVVIVGLMTFSAMGVLGLAMLKWGNDLSLREKRAMLLVAIGGLATPLALSFDELWHRFMGLDQTAWSAPHAIMFAAIAAILIGLAIFTAKHKDSPFSMLFFATVILLGLFSFADFDQPHMSWVKDIRPGFTYPITAAGISTFTLLLMVLLLKKPGAATIAASLAWGTHFIIGYSIGAIGGFSHTLPSFPIMIPALALDIALILSKNTNFRHDFKSLLALSFFAATVTYWSAIAWSALYTFSQAPQQISGNIQDWFIWYLAFIPAASLFIACLAQRFARWFMPHTT